MAFLQPAPGREARGKARSLVLPCSAGESEEIILPANTMVPHLCLPRALTGIPPRRCVADGTAQAPLGTEGLPQQGLLLALKGALSQIWPPGAPWLQGTGVAHRSS